MAESETINLDDSGKVVASDGNCCTAARAPDGPVGATNANVKEAEETSSITMKEGEERSAKSAKSSEAADQAPATNIQEGGKSENLSHQDDQCQPGAIERERPSSIYPSLSAEIQDHSTRNDKDDNTNDNHDDQKTKSPIDVTKAAVSPLAVTEAAQSIVENGGGKLGHKMPLDQFERKPSIAVTKNGWIRHIIAVLALSSIVLANMNRQVFNQSLPSMVSQGQSAVSAAGEVSGPVGHEIIPPVAFVDPPPVMNLNDTAGDDQNSQEQNSAPIDDDSITTTAISTNRGQEEVITTSIPITTQATTSDVTTTATASPTNGMADIDTTNSIPQMPPTNAVQAQDKFNWTKSQISVLQAAFSYGYMPFMIPGGRMAELYGAKWVVFVSGFGSALCCAVTPLVANNFYLLVGSRIVMGVSQTAVSPALYALLTRWLAPDESSVYLPMIKVGVVLGFAIGSLSSGLLSWRMAFYMTGFVGFLWCFLWTFMVTSDPAEHKRVSNQELDYIEQEIRRLNKGRKQSAGTSRKAPAPWLRILTNPVILSFVAAKFTVKLSTDAQTTQLPMYLQQVFHVSKGTNASIVAANFVIQCVLTGLVAWSAKECVVRGPCGLNKTGVRRLFQGICNFGMGISYLMLTFDMSSLNLAIFAVIVLALSSMFGSGGEAVLPIDLSVEYSASIMAIANSVANLSGIVLPAIVKFILSSSDNNWAMVWWVVGATIILGGLTFTLGVRAEIQDFSSPRGTKNQTVQNSTKTGKVESLDDDSGDFIKIELTAF